MSSRNALLSAEQRANVPIISKTLFAARNIMAQKSVKEMIDWVTTEINANNELDVEYFEISNAKTLQPITKWSDADEVVGCIAVQVGNVRLIDNVIFK
jgi:pantoate--beta-alanine ligase